MIYFTSDQHLNHTNIIQYCKRPFNDTDHMNETIITNWNNIVGNQDDVYVLGDFCMGLPHQWNGLVNRLKGNIHLILGNHDNKKYYQTIPKVVEITKHTELVINNQRISLHHYPAYHYKANIPNRQYDLYLCGHVHEAWKYNVTDPKKIEYNVGVDVNDFYPITLEDINEEITYR